MLNIAPIGDKLQNPYFFLVVMIIKENIRGVVLFLYVAWQRIIASPHGTAL